jgi:hypothetical protein
VLGDLTEDEVAELLGLIAEVEDAAVLQQCSGSMTFWCGTGSADPDSDPDPSIFITDLQDANKKLIF